MHTYVNARFGTKQLLHVGVWLHSATMPITLQLVWCCVCVFTYKYISIRIIIYVGFFFWVPINTMIRYVSFTQMNAPTEFTFDTLPFVMHQNCGCHTTPMPCHVWAWNASRCCCCCRRCFSSLHFNLIEWDGLSLVTFTFSPLHIFSPLDSTPHSVALPLPLSTHRYTRTPFTLLYHSTPFVQTVRFSI